MYVGEQHSPNIGRSIVFQFLKHWNQSCVFILFLSSEAYTPLSSVIALRQPDVYLCKQVGFCFMSTCLFLCIA